MKATISYFIKSCILDSTTTNDTCPILMQEICDKFLIDNSIKIYIINKDIGIECIARLLFFWDNIFLFDKFQNLLKPLYMQFESDLIEQSCLNYSKIKSENYIKMFTKIYGKKDVFKINKRRDIIEQKVKYGNIYLYIKKLCINIDRACALYYNNYTINKPQPEIWILNQTEMRNIYKTEFINHSDKDPEQKYMKWMYDNFPENMDKHIKNYDKLGLPPDICEIYYDLSTIKTHHI
jgi:hypothetical protein